MSEADKLFEELGYRITLNTEDTLIYKHKTDFFEQTITFDKRDYRKCFDGVDGHWLAKDADVWVTQKFRDDFDKYCSKNGYWESIWHEFSIAELKAINLKVKELGWEV